MGEIWGIIGFILLIAIIFGITPHEAFWGVAGVILVIIAALVILGLVGLAIEKWGNNKPAKPQVKQQLAPKQRPIKKPVGKAKLPLFIRIMLVVLAIYAGMVVWLAVSPWFH